MRFARYGHVPFKETAKKRAAYEQSKARELARFPLLAAEIAEGQTFIDIEMHNRRTSWDRQTAEQRARRAADWRRARAKLASYRYSVRRDLRDYWQRCSWPADPTYLLSMMHMHDTGRLELRPKPFRQTVEQREAVTALFARWAQERAAKAGAVADRDI